MNRTFKRTLGLVGILSLLVFCVPGCQSALFTAVYLIKGTDVKPKHEILCKGEMRVAVAARSLASNQYEIQNAPRQISRQVAHLINVNVQNKKLRVVDPSKIDAWLDDCNNDFDSFVEIGRAKKIDADIIIGIEIMGFQIRDPHSPYLVQGRCQAQVQAIDCKTGEVVANETLTIVDPPNMPIPSAGPGMEAAFRPQFIQVVAEQIAVLFHHHDPHKARRIDSDNLEMHRFQ